MTNEERKVIELALEALESALRYHGIMLMSDPPQDAWKYHRVENKADKAITAMKELLAQPEQKPVAWEQFYFDIGKPQLTHPPQGIYYTPPQRKPLSDEEMKKIWYAMQNIMGWYSFQEIARAIEAAHNIKE